MRFNIFDKSEMIITVMKCRCGVGFFGSSLYGKLICVNSKLNRVNMNTEIIVNKNDFGFFNSPTNGIWTRIKILRIKSKD